VPPTPPCTALGRQCRELPVTLRIADKHEDSQTFLDAAATWLTGHTEHIKMGAPHFRGSALVVDAVLHVPCKYLRMPTTHGAGRARCTAHGYRGPVPSESRLPNPKPPGFRNPDGTFDVVFKNRRQALPLPLKRSAQRQLPVAEPANPCATAPCRTADNKRGAACCRDLTLEIVTAKSDTRTELLLRARKSPYLCKVSRTSDDIVECEMISACGYLGDDGITCALHDRILPNGRLAKPSICYEWPDLGPDDTGHPGCVFLKDGKVIGHKGR
jgi:hypothetical protein